jgi:hypothetical protein
VNVTAVLITRERAYPQDIRVDFPFDEVLVETSCPNVRRRYELALRAKSDVIYTQDDDAEIDIPALWAHYDGRLTNAITPYHRDVYAPTGMTLVGWGCFFPKLLIDFSRWEARYGEVDEVEADRIFTYLAQPHNTVVMPIAEHKRREQLCQRPDHYPARDRILAKLRALR